MKKLLYPAALIAIISFASCKKEYTCTCTTTDSSNNATATSEITIHSTRKDAAKDCAAQGQHTSTGNSSSHTYCEVE